MERRQEGHRSTGTIRKRETTTGPSENNYKISKWLFIIIIVLCLTDNKWSILCNKTQTLTNNKHINYNNTTSLNTKHPQTNYITCKKLNKIQHTINGNNYLDLLHWNKGKTLFRNKTTDIDQILSMHNPHILSLCEANIEKIINNTENYTYTDYNIEHTKMAAKTSN